MPDSGTIKKFTEGQIIYSEGDPSSSAFVVVKGTVELTKKSKFGPVLLAKLKSGEIFGEMSVIDGSPRSATARAVGNTVIKEIPPEALLSGIQKNGDLSGKVMTKLVERLRAADDMLVKAGVSPVDGGTPKQVARPQKSAAPQNKKPGFFSRLFNTQKGREATIEILLADFLDDENKQVTAYVFEQLKARVDELSGGLIKIRKTDSAFPINDFTESPMIWGQVKTNASKWLKELEGDLLIWGQVRSRGRMVHLRFAPLYPLRNDRAGYIQPCDGLDLPLEFEDPISTFLYGICVGALIPSSKEQREALETLLPGALDGARPLIQKRMRDLDGDEQVRLECAFANLSATNALMRKNKAFFKEAEETYIKAIRSIRRSKSPLLEGIAKRHLAYTQSSWFDMGGEANLLEAAIETFRECLDFFTKEAYPQEWADLQSMIGQLLFKKDARVEDDIALKESITAYQNALQVFSASATPQRWGDAKHHLARALQLLGSQTGDLDKIARAAEACREALAVRDKMQTPMLWAATQNNLGSALFMLCQKTRKPETAEAAVKAFQAALEVYQARKAAKLAQVTQKNLSRAQEVAIDIGPVIREEAIPEAELIEHHQDDEEPVDQQAERIEGNFEEDDSPQTDDPRKD